MIMTKEDIISIIEDDWKYNKDIKLVCLRIVEWLGSMDARINYKTLKNVVGNLVSDEYLLRAIQYLSGDRVKVLKPRFQVHFDGCYIYGVTPEYIKEAREKGFVRNPVTNQDVAYDDSMIIISFESLIL